MPLLIKEGHQAVQPVPVAPHERNPIFGSGQGFVAMAEDFDAPLDGYKEYMQ